MYLPPIPKTLLPDKAVLLIPQGSGVFGDELYSTVEMENVRIEMISEREKNSENTVVRNKGILYFDCVNSTMSKDIKLDITQKLGINGIKYSISNIKIVMGADKPHHYKITFC